MNLPESRERLPLPGGRWRSIERSIKGREMMSTDLRERLEALTLTLEDLLDRL